MLGHLLEPSSTAVQDMTSSLEMAKGQMAAQKAITAAAGLGEASSACKPPHAGAQGGDQAALLEV